MMWRCLHTTPQMLGCAGDPPHVYGGVGCVHVYGVVGCVHVHGGGGLCTCVWRGVEQF